MHLEENKSDLLGIIKKGGEQDRKRLTMMDMHNRGGNIHSSYII